MSNVDLNKKNADTRLLIYRIIEIMVFVVSIILAIVFKTINKDASNALLYTMYPLLFAPIIQIFLMCLEVFIEKRKPFGNIIVSKMLIPHIYGVICSMLIALLLIINVVTEDNVFVYWLIFMIIYTVGYVLISIYVNYKYNPKTLMNRYKKEHNLGQKENDHE